jgi:polyhydroxyalkanoate depolymerase
MAPVRIAARASRAALSSPLNPLGQTGYGRSLAAMADVFESATRYYGKPEWRIDSVRVNSAPIKVTPTVAWRTPWCSLVHFRKDPEALAAARDGAKLGPQPRLLIAAPLSGHYATLLRGTVEAFLPTHDVYDIHGISHRHAAQPDRSKCAGRGKASVMVRGEHDPHRAGPLPRHVPAGLSGLRPVGLLHEHELVAPC